METGGFGLAGRQWRWEAMGDCLELSYGGLQFRERERERERDNTYGTFEGF